jgi:hypothetical protein
VEAHGGTIELEELPDREEGCSFLIKMPSKGE